MEGCIHETGYQLLSIPGVSIASAGKIISEIGDINRFKNERGLARFSGIAPVSIGKSGKNKEEHSRGGNRYLRVVIYFIAEGMLSVSIKGTPRNPYFRDYYLVKLQQEKKVTVDISISYYTDGI